MGQHRVPNSKQYFVICKITRYSVLDWLILVQLILHTKIGDKIHTTNSISDLQYKGA